LPTFLAGCTPGERKSSEGLDFDPIAPVPEKVDAITVPYGYRWTPILRWGDPLFADSPDFAPGSPNAAAQALQFGYNNDFLAIMDIDDSGRSALLCCNHEFTNRAIMFPPSESEIQEQEALKATMAAERGRVVQFLAVPYQAETCGPVIDDRDGSVFVAVQHPGEEGSWDEQLSYFPDYVPARVRPRPGAWRGPRSSVIQVTRRG
jgi:secreted PhoX family phosphatase